MTLTIPLAFVFDWFKVFIERQMECKQSPRETINNFYYTMI